MASVVCVQVISHIYDKEDLPGMVNASDLSNWRETLAIIFTYSNGEKFRALINQLAERFVRPHACTHLVRARVRINPRAHLHSHTTLTQTYSPHTQPLCPMPHLTRTPPCLQARGHQHARRFAVLPVLQQR